MTEAANTSPPPVLPMFVIYESPDDHPDRFVVRRWLVSGTEVGVDDEPLAVVDTLDEARAVIPPGLFYISRTDDDAPAILEVWL